MVVEAAPHTCFSPRPAPVTRHSPPPTSPPSSFLLSFPHCFPFLVPSSFIPFSLLRFSVPFLCRPAVLSVMLLFRAGPGDSSSQGGEGPGLGRDGATHRRQSVCVEHRACSPRVPVTGHRRAGTPQRVPGRVGGHPRATSALRCCSPTRGREPCSPRLPGFIRFLLFMVLLCLRLLFSGSVPPARSVAMSSRPRPACSPLPTVLS